MSGMACCICVFLPSAVAEVQQRPLVPTFKIRPFGFCFVEATVPIRGTQERLQALSHLLSQVRRSIYVHCRCVHSVCAGN